ncbi:MAG: XrtA/PEP-CTERM system amidotransferase [Gammaproteobacteria bacterium]
MCGIVGVVRHDTKAVDPAVLAAMTTRLEHRGPDQHGYFHAAGVGLGHRRLSIIDLSAGRQPMRSADGQVTLTFNGEIYNYREIRAELAAAGHAFESDSDTEVLLHAWLEWGECCVDHLRGMFAFGVWDARRELLFLARDRLGIKPIYYAQAGDGSFLFASELKALRAYPAHRDEIDPRALEDYFAFGYVPEPRSIYAGTAKLPAGHTLSWTRGQKEPVVTRYWDIPFHGNVPQNEDALGAELVERLREAVSIRLVADVPLGAFLSGGVDSSAVVALMTETSPDPVRTFSISFDEPAFDESAYSAAIAERFHTRHTTRAVAVDDFELIDALAGIYDEPFADSSALPTFRVCQLAREHVTVALSGDGGDENFGGYWRYREFLRAARAQARFPAPLRALMHGPLASLVPGAERFDLARRVQDKLHFWGRDLLENYMHSVSIVKQAERRAMYSEGFRASLDGYDAFEVLRGHAERAPVQDGLARILYVDFKTYLVDDILTKVDRASMANSLEVRVPVLDHRFVEWASAVPDRLKMQGEGEGKYILKRALESRLPHDILYRRKRGFAVPLPRWFQGPLAGRVQDMLRSEVLNDCGYLSPDWLRQLARRLERGWFPCSPQLWSLMMFESFLRARQAGR